MSILILIFTCFSFSQELEVPKDYYAISNTYLQILKLNNNELVFYGGDPNYKNLDGSVLKTNDNAETFEQFYCGTKHFIYSMMYSNNILYGVTSGGELITSFDNGNYWSANKISNSELVGITKIENTMFILSKDGLIYYSKNHGENWEETQTPLSKCTGIYKSNSKLIISDITSKQIYLCDYNKLNWEKYILGHDYDKIYYVEDNLYFYNNSNIYKLKENLETINYNLNKQYAGITLVEYNDNLLFSESFSNGNNYGIKIYELDLIKNEVILIDSLYNSMLGFSTFELVKYEPIDIVYSNNELIISSAYKTVIKYNKLNKWKIQSSYSPTISGSFIIDSTNWFFQLTSNSNNYFSSNKGVTFNIIEPYYQYFNDDTVKSVLINAIFKDNKNALIQFSDGGYGNNNENKATKYHFAYSSDGLKSVNILDFKFNGTFKFESLINYYNGYYYLYSSELKSNNLFKSYICRVNSENFNLDTLVIFEDSIKSYKAYFDDNKIWLYGKNEATFMSSDIYLSEDNGISFKKVAILQHSSSLEFIELLIKDKNGEYYIIMSENFYHFNINTYQLEKIEIPYTHLGRLQENTHFGYLEDKRLQFLNVSNGKVVDRCISYITISDNVEFNIIEKVDRFFPYYSIFDDSKIYISNHGTRNNLYKPIEPDRIAYYTSVEKTEQRNYLYTFPPFPQPTKQEVKISTYWDSALPFTINDVEIYNLAGIMINTENKLSINKETNYNGHIIWDTSGEQAGIYIVNIKHGTEIRTQKIMVEK